MLSRKRGEEAVQGGEREDPFHQRADTQAARNRRDAPALDTVRCERTNEIPEGRVGGR